MRNCPSDPPPSLSLSPLSSSFFPPRATHAQCQKRDEKEAQENAIREVIMPNDDSNCCALLSTHSLHPALSVLPSLPQPFNWVSKWLNAPSTPSTTNDAAKKASPVYTGKWQRKSQDAQRLLRTTQRNII